MVVIVVQMDFDVTQSQPNERRQFFHMPFVVALDGVEERVLGRATA